MQGKGHHMPFHHRPTFSRIRTATDGRWVLAISGGRSRSRRREWMGLINGVKVAWLSWTLFDAVVIFLNFLPTVRIPGLPIGGSTSPQTSSARRGLRS